MVPRHRVNFLGRIADPDGDNGRAGTSQFGQGPVIKSAAPAKPIAGPVEGQQRHQKQVGTHVLRPVRRMTGAEHAVRQLRPRRPGPEPKRLRLADDHRQAAPPADGGQGQNCGEDIHFILHGEIAGCPA